MRRPSSARAVPLAAWCASLFVAACASAPEPKPEPEGPEIPPPTFAADKILGPCWPDDATPEQRVVLTLIRDGRTLKDVMFETQNGASNSVGRCLRQVLWTYPWRGDIPDTLELSPPTERPHGWIVLEHVRLLAARQYGPERGLLDPVPLVHACLKNGTGTRPGVQFYVQTQPVRVFALAAGIGSVLKPSEVVTDSERCVQAVLSSTVYPGSRPYAFDFNRGAPAGDPAPREQVAQYFEPANAGEAPGQLDHTQAKAVLSGLNPEIGACWDAALNRRGGLSGARTFRIRVVPSGSVAFSHVIADRSTAGTEAVDYLLDRCVAATVAKAKIPPPEGGPAELAYSWVFALRQ